MYQLTDSDGVGGIHYHDTHLVKGHGSLITFIAAFLFRNRPSFGHDQNHVAF